MNDNGRVPTTAIEVVQHLGELSRELDRLVHLIGEEDRVSTVCREDYTRAYARAWRAAVGSVEARKQIALQMTQDERLAAEMSDCVIRDLRRQIDALKVRIDVGRSYGAAVRAESNLLNSPYQPHGA